MLDINGAFRSVKSVPRVNERTQKEYFQITAVHNFSIKDEAGEWQQSDQPIWVNFHYWKDLPKGTPFTASFSSRPWLGSDGKVLIAWTPSWLIATPPREVS